MVGVPFTISSVQAASVWTRVAGLRLLEPRREGHAEAGGVRGGDQLLGVGAFLSFEAGREGIGSGEGAARRFEAALAVLELPFPHRGRLARWHRNAPTLLGSRSNLAGRCAGRYA